MHVLATHIAKLIQHRHDAETLAHCERTNPMLALFVIENDTRSHTYRMLIFSIARLNLSNES